MQLPPAPVKGHAVTVEIECARHELGARLSRAHDFQVKDQISDVANAEEPRAGRSEEIRVDIRGDLGIPGEHAGVGRQRWRSVPTFIMRNVSAIDPPLMSSVTRMYGSCFVQAPRNCTALG